MSDRRYVTVTALTKYIKKKFDVDTNLHDIWIKAELSNVKIHSRGHIYFTLKDEGARIQGVMFSSQNQHLHFRPENGMKVLVRGEITVFETYGSYQIYVSQMEPDGIGNLYLAYEELKKKLSNEGLFHPDRKKPIPSYPETIGIVTSPTGAAIRDIIITIKRRFPVANIIVYPTLVQGPKAPESIVKSINEANKHKHVDVLIIGRGGGSLEDLWSFNEEVVARAIDSSIIPIISAVGHETDYTIADFVADLRAPTPTGAAEMAVPHINELKERINQRKVRLERSLRTNVASKEETLKRIQNAYVFRSPKRLYIQKEQELDRLMDRLQKEITRYYQKKREKISYLEKRILQQHPNALLQREKEKLKNSILLLEKTMSQQLKEKELLLGQGVKQLNALNPLKVMERGYSLAFKEEGSLIKSVTQIHKNDRVNIQLKDGIIDCQVIGKEEGEGE